jgi:hypothetical protein
VAVRVAYDLVSAEDGSVHTIEAYGEALDASDKATPKALQSAYKYALLQAFAVPVAGTEDADARSPRLKAPEFPGEPVQGWHQWCADISEMIAGCGSEDAIIRVQQTYRGEFGALQRERAALYAELGQVVARQRAELRKPAIRSSEADTASQRESRAEGAGEGRSAKRARHPSSRKDPVNAPERQTVDA